MDQSSSQIPAARGEDWPAPYRRYFWLLVCAWTAAVAGWLVWNLRQQAQETRLLTAQTARALLEKDLLYREWSILHGGVYVPKPDQDQRQAPPRRQEPIVPAGQRGGAGSPQERQPPRAEEREITAPSGRVLTLLNPAIVSREVFALQREQMGIRGHLTSLAPVRSENGPDAWERRALQTFARGVKEFSSVETERGERYLRMMRPLSTQTGCLQCHEEQHRRPGSLRGGISVSVPLSRFSMRAESVRLAVGHVYLWLLGLAGVWLGARDLRRHVRARRRAEAEREQTIVQLQKALAQVKTLTGLIPICASCKKIRNDQGYWTRLEDYLQQHSEAQFSHGLCLDCLRTLYPEIAATVEAELAARHPATPATPAAPAPPSPLAA